LTLTILKRTCKMWCKDTPFFGFTNL